MASLELGVGDLLEKVLDDVGYVAMLEAERTIESQGRMENLQELVGVAREFENRGEEGAGMAEFLQEISLFSEQDAIEDERSEVTLMTLHNAKGLEFPVVFMIGLEEGLFPHQRSLEEQNEEEERRLCYVGMTRAREQSDADPRPLADDLRRALLQPAVTLPLGAPRGRGRAAPPGAGLERTVGGGGRADLRRPASTARRARRAVAERRRRGSPRNAGGGDRDRARSRRDRRRPLPR